MKRRKRKSIKQNLDMVLEKDWSIISRLLGIK